MPLHFAYYPEKHGYYYFRPYNYQHILEHQQIAPLLGADPQAPYETEMFQKFYAAVPDIDLGPKQDETLQAISPEDKELPNLEDLLGPEKKNTKKDSKTGTPSKAEKPGKTEASKPDSKSSPKKK
ncbi:MAG: hypothetical protein Tsb009_05050 [Planctomycetaceae bacterium]